VQYKEEADEYEVQREAESLNNARQREKSLELEREKTSIVAPFDGIVARRYVRVGQKVLSGSPFLGHGYGAAAGEIHVAGTVLRQNPRGEEVTVSSADISREAKYSAKIVQVSP